MDSRRFLVFHGSPKKGAGKFSIELVIPGRNELADAPPDWPEYLQPGTLNIFVQQLPPTIPDHENTAWFDLGEFSPAVIIPSNLIQNNTLPATPELPQRGTGQAWRVVMRTGTKLEIHCWMFRRIGSRMPNRIELVSECCLRDLDGVTENHPVTLTIFEG